MTLSTGEGVEAVITGYTTGKSGSPGELKGQFVAGRTFAGLTANSECGSAGPPPDYIRRERLPVAFSHEVQPAPLKMLTTIAGGAPREYDVVIEKVLRGSGHRIWSSVTDENKMGTMPVKNKLLVTMSLPMVISMIVQALYNIVDSIFVSRLSEDALTAVSMAFPMQTL